MSLPQPNPDTAFMRRLADLEKQVAALTTQGLLNNAGISAYLGANGSNRGIKVFDASKVERIRLGVSEAGNYGLTVNDGTRDRVQVGQIPSGGYGLEIHDAAGNLIADAAGLVRTLVVAGSLEYTTAGVQSMPALATTAIANSSFSFTTPASRTVNVLLLATVNAQVQTNNAGAFSQNTYFQVSGQTRSARGMIPFLTNAGGFGPQSTVTLFQVLTGLSGGTYTGNWWFINPFNGAINVDIGDITVYAFQLGS